MRLIDADAWKRELLLFYGTDEKTAWFIRRINHAPSVDAEPVVETSITIREMGSFNELRCSKCGKPWLWSGDLFIFNYCPCCGAKVTDKHYINITCGRMNGKTEFANAVEAIRKEE